MAFASMPLQYKRLYNGPLDQDSVFESLEDAQAYAEGPTSYPGQIIGVKVDGVRKMYIINDDSTLSTSVDQNDIVRMMSWQEL